MSSEAPVTPRVGGVRQFARRSRPPFPLAAHGELFGDYAGDQVLAAAWAGPARAGPGEFVSAWLVPGPPYPALISPAQYSILVLME
jgi:hypothetical protein